MQLKQRLGALILTGVLMMGMGTSVFAEDTPTVGKGTQESNATVSVNKNLELAEGITLPDDGMTFRFTLQK